MSSSLSSSLLSSLLLLLLLSLASLPLVGAQFELAAFEEGGRVGTHRQVSTSLVFTQTASPLVVAGSVTELLVAFENNSPKTFNVTGAQAHLRSVDHVVSLSNYSEFAYPGGVVVPPEEAATVFYLFRTDAMLEPKDYGFELRLLYSDDRGDNFTATAFNDTISVVEPRRSSFDFGLLLSYIALFATMFGVSYAIFGDRFKVVATVSAFVQQQLKARRAGAAAASSSSSSSSSLSSGDEMGTRARGNADWLGANTPTKRGKKK